MGKNAARYRLCRCRCRCKINNLMRHLQPLYLPWPSSSPDPFLPFGPTLLCPLSRSRTRSVLFHDHALLWPPLPRNCWLPRTPLYLRNCVGCASGRIPSELESHRQILALGLTERVLNRSYLCGDSQLPNNVSSELSPR